MQMQSANSLVGMGITNFMEKNKNEDVPFFSPLRPFLGALKGSKWVPRGQKKWHIFVLLVVVFLGFFLIKEPVKNPVLENIKSVQIAGQNIRVDLAITSETHEQGLSGRASLAGDSGMLFVFEYPDKYAFWMKDMNFAIDIIWLNENLQVVYIKDNVLPSSYPEIYQPEEKAKYVLEVVSGFTEKNNLKIGDTVKFVY